MIKRLFFIILLTTLTTGCGFRLSGGAGDWIGPSFVSITHPDHANKDYRSFLQALENRLDGNGVVVMDDAKDIVDSQQQSFRMVEITGLEYTRTTRTRDTRGLATSYELVYEIEFDLLDASRTQISETSHLLERRTLEFLAGQELEAEREEDFLKKRMERELVSKVVRRINR